jgi:hypothetical protein
LNPVATTNFSELSEREAGGLTLATFSKRCLSTRLKPASAPPASTLATKVPPGRQHVEGQLCRRLAKGDDAQMVRLLVPRGCRGHVAHDHIGGAIEPGLDLVIGAVFEEVEHVKLGAGDRVDLLQVDADDTAHRLAGFCPSALIRGTATWHQPPGAQPRSTTRAPGTRKRNLSSSSRIL